LIGLSAAALLLFAAPAGATSNLVTDGDFSSLTYSNGATNGGMLGYNVSATGWTVATPAYYPSPSYALVFTPSTLSTGVPTIFGHNVTLWPGTSPALAVSPYGGNFVALDGDVFPGNYTGALSQTITGLTPGKTYNVSFYYSYAQQGPDPADPSGFSGATNQAMNVCLGAAIPGDSFSEEYVNTTTSPLSGGTNASSNIDCTGASASTSLYTLGSHDFSGWNYVTFGLTANATTDVLSFLAYGNVQQPPFVLLDDISMTQQTPVVTPEPETLPLIFTGLIAGIGALRLKKWRKR
jgi:hypothetical protein